MNYLKKILKLTVIFFMVSISIILTIHSNLGASPWDVFHLGLVKHTSLTLGQASQVTSLVVIVIATFVGEYPGVGTIINMYLIGVFIDFVQAINLIPVATVWWEQYLMLFLGMYIMAWGVYFYLAVGLGSGPRDSLMVGLTKRTKKPVWQIRTVMEGSILIVGYFLGGLAGIGTLLTVVLMGPMISHCYKVMNSNLADVQHRTFIDEYHYFKKFFMKKAHVKQ